MAHRRVMDVASQNIANANTEGYSRQRADLQAIGGSTIAGVYAHATPVGNGVTVDDVQRIRNAFLENRGRTDHASAEYLNAKDAVMDGLQNAFSEPSDTALQSQLGELWGGFADVANRPDDPAARTALIERATIVADTIHGSGETIATLWANEREAVTQTVSDINTMAADVAKLNESIVAGKVSGAPVNELSDQRDQLVMKLAELAGARGIIRDDGSMDVSLGGSTLVYGNAVRKLVPNGADLMKDRLTNPVQVTWADTGTAAIATSGKLAAHMESLTTTIPKYAGKLDNVANSLTTAVNTLHHAGFDQDGNAGGDFFTGANAADFKVVVGGSRKVAAASTTGATIDGNNADAIADLQIDETGPDRTYRQMVVDLGVDAQSVNRRAKTQAAIVNDTDAARNAESGVSIDEEMTNMVTSERAYQAAAKVISTIDEMLDTLINRM